MELCFAFSADCLAGEPFQMLTCRFLQRFPIYISCPLYTVDQTPCRPFIMSRVGDRCQGPQGTLWKVLSAFSAGTERSLQVI